MCSIDLAALAHNLAEVRRVVGRGVAVCGVVKANAYGHGAVPVARRLVAAGAEHLAVASFDEAAELRQAGSAAPILIFGGVRAARAREAADLGLAVALWSARDARAIAGALAPGQRLAVHVKVDTGMHRFGAAEDELA